MNKTHIAKQIVRHVTSYSIGTAAAVFFNNNRKHSDNIVIETAIDGSTFVTGLAVAAVVHEPVGTYTDAQIEKLSAWLQANFKK